MEPKRLNKFISDTGFCSRREADTLLEQGRITVNGKIPEPGVRVTPKDKVRIDDQLLNVREEKPVFLAFHKPANMSATSDMSVKNNVVRAINYPATLEPVGMLEREAEGIIFLSNDEEFVRLVKRADNKFEKEYVVSVDKMITPDFLAKISGGGSNDFGEERKNNAVSKQTSTRFRITLKPGTDHYLKRMCESLGYKVTHLQRLRFNGITLAKLAPGHWRALTPTEVEELKSVAMAKGERSGYRDADGFGAERSAARNASAARGSFGKSGRPEAGTSRSRSAAAGEGRSTEARDGAKGSAGNAKNTSASRGAATKSNTGRDSRAKGGSAAAGRKPASKGNTKGGSTAKGAYTSRGGSKGSK